jgi:uncharacterized protein with ParB-like and HNH nuclease domain
MERVDYERIVIQDLLNLNKSGGLDLNPWYQRRSVWTRPQKAYLVNTLFEQKPVPTCYIRHYLDVEKEKSIKEVVDGQQRIRTILEYENGEFAAKHPDHKKRVKISELTAAQKSKFKMTAISIGYLINADDTDVIEIFGRLNSVAKTLNGQEKRNAKFSGEFKQFCLAQAARRVKIWRDLGVFTATDIARMNEVQFTSELVINMLDGISDYSSKKVDDYYAKFEDTFSKAETITKRMEKVFSLIVKLTPKAIKDTIFARSPLFFSLFIALDSVQAKISPSALEEGLFAIDKSFTFNSDVPVADRKKADADFIAACTASTQRIKSRKIRDSYIRKALKLG